MDLFACSQVIIESDPLITRPSRFSLLNVSCHLFRVIVGKYRNFAFCSCVSSASMPNRNSGQKNKRPDFELNRGEHVRFSTENLPTVCVPVRELLSGLL